MKQLKFLMVALTLLMGVSLTSCLNDNAGESAYDGIGYVRAWGIYFTDLEGNTYYPTSTSIAEMEKQGFEMSYDGDLTYIAFKYVEDTPNTKATGGTTTPKSFHIRLVNAATIDSDVTVSATSVEEMEESVIETAPVVTLKPTDVYGHTYEPWMYGAEMLVLPISWKMENKEEMLQQHTLRLVYVEDAEAEDNNELVFYLRHDKGADTKTEVFAIRNKAYDVKYIMEDFKALNGNYPTKITIKVKASDDGATLPESYTDYTLTPNWNTQINN